MKHSARILADSVSPDGVRLTTLEVTFPRIVLAEFNTHRMLSRNSASSRAIPIEKMIKMVNENPYIPTSWPKNQKGMQASEDLTGEAAASCAREWLHARDNAIVQVFKLMKLELHKQTANRLLEPFMWHTVIASATEWSNFFNLRRHRDAHPEIRLAADLMHEAMVQSTPKKLRTDDWHLPLVDPGEYADSFKSIADAPVEDIPRLMRENLAQWCKISVGRCARVSYLTHNGRRDLDADVELCGRLLASGHMSPFEHVARPATPDDCANGLSHWNDHDELAFDDRPLARRTFFGNLRGWVQLRKTFPNEHDILGGVT